MGDVLKFPIFGEFFAGEIHPCGDWLKTSLSRTAKSLGVSWIFVCPVVKSLGLLPWMFVPISRNPVSRGVIDASPPRWHLKAKKPFRQKIILHVYYNTKTWNWSDDVLDPVCGQGAELWGLRDGSFRGEFWGLSTRVFHSGGGLNTSLKV